MTGSRSGFSTKKTPEKGRDTDSQAGDDSMPNARKKKIDSLNIFMHSYKLSVVSRIALVKKRGGVIVKMNDIKYLFL